MKPETKRLVDAAMKSAHGDGIAAARDNGYLFPSPARRALDAHLDALEARAAAAERSAAEARTAHSDALLRVEAVERARNQITEDAHATADLLVKAACALRDAECGDVGTHGQNQDPACGACVALIELGWAPPLDAARRATTVEARRPICERCGSTALCDWPSIETHKLCVACVSDTAPAPKVNDGD